MRKALLLILIAHAFVGCASQPPTSEIGTRSIASSGQLQISPATDSVEIMDGSLAFIFMTASAAVESFSQKYTWSRQVSVSNGPAFTEVRFGSLPDGLYKIRVGRFGKNGDIKKESSMLFAIRNGILVEMSPDIIGQFKITKNN